MDKFNKSELSEEEQIRAWRKASEGCCGEGKIVWPKLPEDVVESTELALDPQKKAEYTQELEMYIASENAVKDDPVKLKKLIMAELTKQIDLSARNLQEQAEK